MSNNTTQLEKTIGINFKDKKLLLDAITHRSFLNESPENIQSNERLEFLGDAVLELLVSDYLFRRFTDFPEGKLTNLRSAIVNTKTLGEIGKKLKFGDYLRLSKGEEAGGGRTNSSLLADVFEAVLGAIFIDQGIVIAKKFLDKYLYSQTAEILSIGTYNDYKSMLQEKAQEKFRITPTYEVIKEEGPDHNKTFYSRVLVGEVKLGEGKGKSKQEAEQDAARVGLEQWEAK
ncbi:ribonuclease III [Candidatus Gottesmanbacteria bacterium]|nr:ribonuclease III [Candidatus Gottesmanbacteria bacterium]